MATGEGIGGFEAGEIYGLIQSVAMGAKPAASGFIRERDRDELRALLRAWGFDGLHIGFGPCSDGLVEWRCARFKWALRALAWCADGSAALGSFHLHWVQGLLYGYSPAEIDRYLATPDALTTRLPPSARGHMEGNARPLKAGLCLNKNRTYRHRRARKSRQF